MKTKSKLEIPKELEHQRRFIEIASELGFKTARKNHDYGSAFEKVVEIFKVLYPNGIPVHQYGNATLMVRMYDKFCRMSNENPKFFNEDCWHDLMGYCLVRLVSKEKEITPVSKKLTKKSKN